MADPALITVAGGGLVALLGLVAALDGKTIPAVALGATGGYLVFVGK